MLVDLAPHMRHEVLSMEAQHRLYEAMGGGLVTSPLEQFERMSSPIRCAACDAHMVNFTCASRDCEWGPGEATRLRLSFNGRTVTYERGENRSMAWGHVAPVPWWVPVQA